MHSTSGNSRAEFEQDRRWHFRYAVNGTAKLESGKTSYPAIPVELSLEGINLKTERTPPVDQVLKLRLDVYGFSELIETEVRVIRTRSKMSTAIFLAPQSSLARCISWLSSYDKKAKDSVCV